MAKKIMEWSSCRILRRFAGSQLIRWKRALTVSMAVIVVT